ncbi:MAG: hypothetical protein ACRC1K_03135 [Planctomycetia bacterium]
MMSRTIEIPDELAVALSAEAARQGMTLPDYALRKLSAQIPAGESMKTGADLVAYWKTEGLVGSRPEIEDSQDHARRLREQAERREA